MTLQHWYLPCFSEQQMLCSQWAAQQCPFYLLHRRSSVVSGTDTCWVWAFPIMYKTESDLLYQQEKNGKYDTIIITLRAHRSWGQYHVPTSRHAHLYPATYFSKITTHSCWKWSEFSQVQVAVLKSNTFLQFTLSKVRTLYLGSAKIIWLLWPFLCQLQKIYCLL